MKQWVQGTYPCPKCGFTNDMIGKHEPCDRAMNFFYYDCAVCGVRASASAPELTLRELREVDE